MPRDKSETHRRLIPCIKQEFLKCGYEKASLKNIASEAGITAAGLYRHFPSKEAMFSAMVEPVTQEFLQSCNESMEETYNKLCEQDFIENFNEFRAEKNLEMVSYMYDNYDAFRLLLVCSKGTSYENFEDQMIQMEQQSMRDLFSVLDKRGIPHNQVTDDELHILCTSLVTAVCEAIRHEYTREEALRHMEFVGKMLYPGMKQVLGF